ncbi:GNAT family N-acetyltransferase [Pedobacter sp. GSP4]|uniref:GNAT family N-acetyltransferase n=1 Tax=Pedobacter sp. GSP4 TaxID=3453716 RepID=UPI003EE860F6
MLCKVMIGRSTLHTDRFLLRQFQPDDLPNVFKGLSHPDVIRYYGVSYTSLEASKEQLSWFNTLQQYETGIWWAICNKANLTFVGAIGFNDLNKAEQKAEIGFWLLPEYWGAGIIKEVAASVCHFAFQNLNLKCIEAIVERENENCRRALQKLGFNYLGTRENCEIKNGKYISLESYLKLLGS